MLSEVENILKFVLKYLSIFYKHCTHFQNRLFSIIKRVGKHNFHGREDSKDVENKDESVLEEAMFNRVLKKKEYLLVFHISKGIKAES